MVISASRRTDIPNYYSDWFYNRIKEKYVYVRNPMNYHQVSKISLSPEVVDCIVFWTKNPESMMSRLEELEGYHYYFQFTLTGYGNEIECHVPNKKNKMLSVFTRLSQQIGSNRVIWRYDPILFNEVYTKEYHIKAFEQIAGALKGAADKCVISFIDKYRKNKRELDKLKLKFLDDMEWSDFVQQLSNIAKNNKMEIATCAENIDLSAYGISHNSCIDQQLIESIIGCRLKAEKDRNQRLECGCIESIDIGSYNTCKNGCIYCYANGSASVIEKNYQNYMKDSPILCDTITKEDKITERKIRSLKESQQCLFDSI